jgi:hypothetical protein
MKRIAQETGADPLKQVEDEGDPTFTDFVLRREAQLMEAKRANLDLFVRVRLNVQEIDEITNLRQAMLQSIVNDSIVQLFGKQLRLSDKSPLKEAALATELNASLDAMGSLRLDRSLYEFPIFAAVLDRFVAFPDAARQIADRFRRIEGTFRFLDASDPGYISVREVIRPEIDLLSELLGRIPNLPCGRQLMKLVEITEIIRSISEVLRIGGLEFAEEKVLWASLPAQGRSELIRAVLRIMRVSLLLSECSIELTDKAHESFRLFFSWITSLLSQNREFYAWLMPLLR